MDSTRWSRALISGVLMASLLLALGCARRDWIDRTLVTVDVTGSWSGRPGGAQFGHPGDLVLELKQEGATVTGMLRSSTTGGTSATGPLFGPVTGTVAGDIFHFKDRRGTLEGELTVSGDEMTGLVSITGTRPITLRRLDLGSAPVSPPR